jgi:membrane-associated protein
MRPKEPMLDFFIHLDDHLGRLIEQYGPWTYGILFLIVFCETGLVVTPFLPGDTLLFAAGIFAHEDNGGLNLWLLYLVFIGAALCGDNVNYQIGRLFGQKLFRNPKSKIFKKENLEKTHAFFERHGPKTIILARFVPIVRTFAPFVAGMGTMSFGRFIGYSIAGAIFWVLVCVTAGYLFGNIPAIKENFALAVVGLVAVSLIPVIVEAMRHRARKKRRATEFEAD